MSVPDKVFNGEYFTPICSIDAIYFDVPNAYATRNCGDSISFGGADGITYEVRDLNGNGDPISSAFTQAVLGSPGVGGCRDINALNYNSSATYGDGSCTYVQVYGCMDPIAINYNLNANNEDGSCTYNDDTPISAPINVYNGEYFTPICGSRTVYFDVPNAYAAINCGQSISFGGVGDITYEIRGLDHNGDPIPPSVYVNAKYDFRGGIEFIQNIIRKIYSYTPTISILSPQRGTLFSSEGWINYIASDENDNGSFEEKNSHGLGARPVSLFYSDKISDWYPGMTILDEEKNLIAKDLPPVNKYKWFTKDLIPGILYRIIAEVVDNSNRFAEEVSDFFSIDITPPVFTVTTNPEIVKKGNVDIFVKSSESLDGAPDVTVIQRGGKPQNVAMNIDKDIYHGVYSVIEGYDGAATIKVSGKDLAGNTSDTIISGGNFSIGVNPPSRPDIIFPQNNTVTNISTTSISGTVREDTEVILTVNGEEIKSTKPDVKGVFVFNNIKLDKLKNQGLNYISIKSKDIFGSISESTDIKIKYNISPVVFISSPKSSDILRNNISIVTKATDENKDLLFYTYQIIPIDEFNSKLETKDWLTIAENTTSNTFNWDSTEVGSGEYIVRAIVSDGIVRATSTPIKMTIKNTLPFIRFEDGRKTITKNDSVTILAKAFVPEGLENTVSIGSVSYSTDNGKSWNKVSFVNKEYKSIQPFSVTLTKLEEGTHPIIFIIKDSRNTTGRSNHLVIVDQTKPKSPEINNLKNKGDNFFNNDSDENKRKNGLQVSISGVSEPVVNIALINGDNVFNTKSLPTGSFSFDNITLKHGRQNIKIFATDQALNIGESSNISLIYNNPSTITFINPKSLRGISGKSALSWNIFDTDLDNIKDIKVSYRKGSDSFSTISTSTTAKGSYLWDTNKLPESDDYQLKISATDGLEQVSSIVNFSIDRTIPNIESFKVGSDKKLSFVGDGYAHDSVSGIEYVEYSIVSVDNKKSDWYKAIITNGFLKKEAKYSIKYPMTLPDGFYRVFVRAVDAAGNISSETSYNFHVDKNPPRIGGFFINKNGVDITPDNLGEIFFYASSSVNFLVSLENDTDSASVFVYDAEFKLFKDLKTGLWQGNILLDNKDVNKIFIKAEDTSGNLTDKKEIGTISSTDRGYIKYITDSGTVEPFYDVQIKVLKLDEYTGKYNTLNTRSDKLFLLASDIDGKYDMVLPAGSYRLVISKLGFSTANKDIVLEHSGVVNISFTLVKVKGIMKFIYNILDLLRY